MSARIIENAEKLGRPLALVAKTRLAANGACGGGRGISGSAVAFGHIEKKVLAIPNFGGIQRGFR